MFSSLFITLALPIISNNTSQLVSITICLFLFSGVYIVTSKFIFKVKEVEEIKLLLIRHLKLQIKW